MVFRCQTCKDRHVKCDAVQPICSRCKKAGRSCIWDPNDHVGKTGLHFKIENSFAQGQPRRPRRTKEALPQLVEVTPPSPPLVQTTTSQSLEVQALYYWIENFMFRLEDLPDFGHEYGAHVLFHWARARPGSSLHLALSALSHAVFGKANHVDQAIKDADRLHAQSIVKIQKDMSAMDELSNDRIDQLLVTTMLMCSYGNVMYGNKSTPGVLSSEVDAVGSRLWKSMCHHEGALALLKLRRQGDTPSLALHRVVRRQLIRTCILRGVLVPNWLQDGAEYGEEGPCLEIDRYMVQVAALRAKSLTLLCAANSQLLPNTHLSEDIVAEAQKLDTALASWPLNLPEDWAFSNEISSATMNSPESDYSYNGLIHSYTTHAHAAVWSRYRASRLIVNSIRIRAHSHQIQDLQYPSQRSFVSIQQDTCQKNIEALTTDLCGGVPFFFNCLNRSGEGTGSRFLRMGKYVFSTEDEMFPKMAALLAWPLTVAVSTEYVPALQREWLKGRLRKVASSLGDAVLESVLEQKEFRF